MDFLALAKKRYSVRNYNEVPVTSEELSQILEAAHVAPSAANQQPCRILVLQSANALEKLEQLTRCYHAPLAVIVCAEQAAAWHRNYDGKNSSDVDAAILTDHMMHEATSLGLSTLWIGWFDPVAVQEAFGIPAELEPVSILAIGHTDEMSQSPERHETTRKPLKALVAYEQF